MQEAIYTREEERLNYSTHAFATILSIVGLFYILTKASSKNDLLLFIAVAVYGLSVTFGFLSSAVYHWVEKPDYKHNCRLLDHFAIYLVIVGTYTPFAVIAMPRSIGIPVLVLVWSLSIIAMLFKYKIWRNKQLQKHAKVDAFVYTVIGSTAFFFLPTFVEYLSWTCAFWVVMGGLTYIVGVLFYLWKSLPYNHLIWHIFAIVAAFIHFYTVLEFVVA